MSSQYLALAEERRATKCVPHKQPEDFGYDFRTWVSPYTQSANKYRGVAVILQDWASEDGLCGPVDDEIQRYGHKPSLLTNKRLKCLLAEVLGLKLCDVYATNAFPFVKSGAMSAPLRRTDVRNVSRKFLARELQFAQPTLVLALGEIAFFAISECGVQGIHLPHPAARIGGLAKHEAVWREALQSAGIPLVAQANTVTF